LFTGLPASVPFKLIVDDKPDPALGGTHTPPTSAGGTTIITIFSNKFRGRDNAELGSTLFHEIIHALFYLHRAYPALSLRTEAERILSPTANAPFRAAVQREVSTIMPGFPMANSIAQRLAEEILVRVETETHEASVSRFGGPPMNQASFNSEMLRYLFAGGHLLTPADRSAITSAPVRNAALTDLLDILYGFYVHYRSVRFRQVGVSPTSFTITASSALPRIIYTPEPLTPPTFVPEIAESVEQSPF